MDKYDEAIAYLTANPEKIWDAWDKPISRDGGCLFDRCAKNVGDRSYGCLTQVRAGQRSGQRSGCFVDEIRADERIPISGESIRIKHFPVFAEWQRKIDKELGR